MSPGLTFNGACASGSMAGGYDGTDFQLAYEVSFSYTVIPEPLTPG